MTADHFERADRGAHCLGIDVGSASLRIGIVDEAHSGVAGLYRQAGGQLMAVLSEVLEELARDFPPFRGAAATGSGCKLVGDVPGTDRSHGRAY